ncbi:MAG: orotidine-5'-phosphate decarboxylase [Candidatus Hydrogenedentota bacterium]
MKDRLLPALDVMTRAEAVDWAGRLSGHVTTVKIGLRLFIGEGPDMVREIRGKGLRIFLDLKLHDIPSTVKAAASASAALDISMMTVHASGGPSMIRAAVEGANGRAKIIAVTVLTSLGPDEAEAIHRDGRSPQQRVLDWAALAIEAGADGVVSSPQEVAALRKSLPSTKRGELPLIITPGIRPASAAKNDDQSRTATAGEAIRNGATHIVVGRPILEAADPIASLSEILGEMKGVLA